MTSFDRIFIDSCAELAPGDAIEAFRAWLKNEVAGDPAMMSSI